MADQREPVGETLERWPGYDQQSWPERFATLDRRYNEMHHAMMGLLAEAANKITAAERRGEERMREPLERLEKAASDYGMSYLLDEHEDPGLCIEPRQHEMIVELADAARSAREALRSIDTSGGA